MGFLTVKDFSGGQTDFPIGGDKSEYELADNLVLDEYRKLVSRPGTELDFTTDLTRARVPNDIGTRRINLMFAQTRGTGETPVIVKQSGDSLRYDNGTTMTELVGPGSASAFDLSSPVSALTSYSYATWNKHTIVTHESPWQIPVKIFNDSGGTLRLRTAGLTPPANTFTATGGGGANHVYALVRYYSYTVGSVTYVDRSTPVLKEFTSVGSSNPASSPGITVGSIPVLSNSTGEHYDTTTIKVEIYRTTNNGTVLYKVGEVTNGTTSFADTVSDNALVNNEPLYTVSGEVENDRPPKCKYVHGTSDFVYYGHGFEVTTTGADGDFLPQRLWQSKRGDPDSVPASFYTDMEQPIVGISSARSVPVVFCENSIYRIDGVFDNLGRGGMIAKKISDSVGAAGHLSLVQTLEGIFFAGTDGFYFTDGYKVVPLSDRFRTTYATLVDTEQKRKRIYGQLNLREQRVYWACYSDKGEAEFETGDDDNSRMFVLDLRQKAFQTHSSGYKADITDVEIAATVDADELVVPNTTGIEVGSFVFGANEIDALPTGLVVEEVVNGTDVRLSKDTGLSSVSLDVVTLSPSTNACFFRNFLPTSLLYFNDKLYFGDRYGFTRYFDATVASDVWIDPSGETLPADFERLPIFFQYVSVAHDFGTTEVRKYVSRILVKARPRLDINAEMTLQIYGENDDSDSEHELVHVFFERFYPWGTAAVQWGDPRLWAPLRNIIDVWRRFPAGKLRCEYKQVRFEPAFVNVYLSSVIGAATIATSGNYKTLTLASGSWPEDIVNYYVSPESDGYTANYLVVERTSSTVIKVLDTSDTLETGSAQQYVVRGYLKESLINLIEYTLEHTLLSSSQQPYQGENAVSQ